MPSSIPYDHPSLVLGNIVDLQIMGKLVQIAALQGETDAAYSKINSFMLMKRSLLMTVNELTDMGVNIDALKKKLTEIDTSISDAASAYMTTNLTNEAAIQTLREEIMNVKPQDMESPLDYRASTLETRPFATTSLKLDAQYFSHAGSEENYLADIESYVRESTENVGPKSNEVAKAATRQIMMQKKNHDLTGTLILTASATHRNIGVIEPFVLDADKAVSAWNRMYSDQRIDTADPEELHAMQEKADDKAVQEKSIPMLSGVAYGSSFVGMVHILKKETTSPSVADAELAAERLKLGSFLAGASGNFGVDSNIAREVRTMLSGGSISSHVSLIVTGATTTLKTTNMKATVEQLTALDAQKISSLSGLSKGSRAGENTEATQAAASNDTARLVNMQAAIAQSTLREVSRIEHENSQVLNTNSLMDAFQEYLQFINKDTQAGGVPIGFYLKRVTRRQIIQTWLDQKYPEIKTQISDAQQKNTIPLK